LLHLLIQRIVNNIKLYNTGFGKDRNEEIVGSVAWSVAQHETGKLGVF